MRTCWLPDDYVRLLNDGHGDVRRAKVRSVGWDGWVWVRDLLPRVAVISGGLGAV